MRKSFDYSHFFFSIWPPHSTPKARVKDVYRISRKKNRSFDGNNWVYFHKNETVFRFSSSASVKFLNSGQWGLARNSFFSRWCRYLCLFLYDTNPPFLAAVFYLPLVKFIRISSVGKRSKVYEGGAGVGGKRKRKLKNCVFSLHINYMVSTQTRF